MARRTKASLLDEAHELGLEVDDSDHYDVISQAVSAAHASAEEEPEAASLSGDVEEETGGDIEPVEPDDPERQGMVSSQCANCSRPAEVTDNAGGRANSVDYCHVHAPKN